MDTRLVTQVTWPACVIILGADKKTAATDPHKRIRACNAYCCASAQVALTITRASMTSNDMTSMRQVTDCCIAMLMTSPAAAEYCLSFMLSSTFWFPGVPTNPMVK
jgi:hypothetical protein